MFRQALGSVVGVASAAVHSLIERYSGQEPRPPDNHDPQIQLPVAPAAPPAAPHHRSLSRDPAPSSTLPHLPPSIDPDMTGAVSDSDSSSDSDADSPGKVAGDS